MQTGQIITDIEALKDPRTYDSLVRWLGTRTREELRAVLGLKRKAFAFLVDRCGRDKKDLSVEVDAFLAACTSVRRHKPHNARTLAKIAAERKELKDLKPNNPHTLKAKLEKDYEEISAYLSAGLTWSEVARELRKNSTKYRGWPLKPDTLRKTWSRINKKNAPKVDPNQLILFDESEMDPPKNQEPANLPASVKEESADIVFPEILTPPEPCGPVETPCLSSPLG